MYLCDDGHQEIVYDSSKCPMCSILQDKHELQDRLQEAKDYINELEEKLDNAEID